jgi:MFS family permease
MSRSFAFIYGFAFLLGTGVGLYLPSAIPVITDCYPERYWGRMLSIHDTATSISIFASPILALFLLHSMGWRGVLQLLGCVCLGCAALFYAMGHDVKAAPPGNRFHSQLFSNPSLWMIGVIWIFATGCNLGLYYITPLYFIKELGIPSGYTNALLGASRLGGVAVAILAGFAADRLSLRKTAFVVILATGISTMALAIPNVVWIKVDLFLQAAISTAFFPLSLVAMSRMFGPETRGPATAFIIMLAVVFGIGVSPYLLGICGDLISFRFGIFVLGCATSASSLLFATMRNL